MLPQTERLSRQFKALSDPHRLRVFALCQHGEASVAEITDVLGQSQPRVSQHLKHLCAADLLRRFRDGRRVYYRLPAKAQLTVRRLVALIPVSDPQFESDRRRLQALRGGAGVTPERSAAKDESQRVFHRALVQQTVTGPLGDLLDVGCGRGDILKLLAGRANRAVGVDIDADARLAARAEVLQAGLANCSLRKGDMYRLPFDDLSFDTIVLDDVLADAERPVAALSEAARLLRPRGRLFLIVGVDARSLDPLSTALTEWCAEAALRVDAPRAIPEREPHWLLAVARSVDEPQVEPAAA